MRRRNGDAAPGAAAPPADRGAAASKLPSLRRQPIRTLRLASECAAEACLSALRWVHARRSVTVYPLLVAVAALEAAVRRPGAHVAVLADAREHLSFSLWWVLLGVLSSVGLGSGLHTGLLFLAPHVAKVVRSAEACCSTDFDSRRNKWLASGAAGELFPCATRTVHGDCTSAGVSVYALVLKTLSPSLLWGVGTALGEVPPYLLARAASRASRATAQQLDPDPSRLVERTKAWMEHVLTRCGFWGLVALAAWPNSLFDFVGVCCGHFGMPFRVFLGGTVLGKGIIKPAWQCALLTTLCSSRGRPWLVESVGSALELALPASVQAKQRLQHLAARATATALAPTNEAASSLLARAWAAAVSLFALYFVATCIEQVAQQRHAQQAKDGED